MYMQLAPGKPACQHHAIVVFEDHARHSPARMSSAEGSSKLNQCEAHRASVMRSCLHHAPHQQYRACARRGFRARAYCPIEESDPFESAIADYSAKPAINARGERESRRINHRPARRECTSDRPKMSRKSYSVSGAKSGVAQRPSRRKSRAVNIDRRHGRN